MAASEPCETEFDPFRGPHDLAEKVMQTLSEDFDDHGAAVLAQLRESDPKSYLTLLCRFVPPGGRETAGSLTVATTIDLAVRDG